MCYTHIWSYDHVYMHLRPHSQKLSETFAIVTTDVDGYIYDQITAGLRWDLKPGGAYSYDHIWV